MSPDLLKNNLGLVSARTTCQAGHTMIILAARAREFGPFLYRCAILSHSNPYGENDRLVPCEAPIIARLYLIADDGISQAWWSYHTEE